MTKITNMNMDNNCKDCEYKSDNGCLALKGKPTVGLCYYYDVAGKPSNWKPLLIYNEELL